MCRSVRDAARYVDAIAGPTDVDPTSLPRPARSYEDALLSGDAVAAAARQAGRRGRRRSASRCATPRSRSSRTKPRSRSSPTPGIELVDVDVAHPEARPRRGASSRTLDGRRAITARRARGGCDDVTPVPRAGFEIDRTARRPTRSLHALRRRDELLAAIAAVFDEVDLLLTPTTATTAFVAEGPPPFEIAGQRVGGMGSVPFTAPFNISGQPAVSIPAGLASDGLPVGLQVVARRHEEELVLACGARRRGEPPVAQVRPDGVHARRVRPMARCPTTRSTLGTCGRDRRSAGAAATAAAGARGGVGRGHRGRAGRAAHAAADLDAGPRPREHVRPRRRPRARRRRPGPARSAVVEGAEGAARSRRATASRTSTPSRHALASRPLRRRGPHRARSGRQARHAPRVLDVDGEGAEPAARALRRRGAARSRSKPPRSRRRST